MINKLILISGKLQSGKNQFSDFLAEELTKRNREYKRDLFAQGVKDGAKEDFRAIWEYLNKTIDRIKSFIPHDAVDSSLYFELEKLKTTDDNFYEDKTTLTRIMLQLYGTDIFRNRVDDNYWIKQLMDRVVKNDVITLVTDVRFPNEIEMLKKNKDLNVVSLRLEREISRIDSYNEHFSEKALDNYGKFDYVIYNNGTLDDLRKESVNFLNYLKIF